MKVRGCEKKSHSPEAGPLHACGCGHPVPRMATEVIRSSLEGQAWGRQQPQA